MSYSQALLLENRTGEREANDWQCVLEKRQTAIYVTPPLVFPNGLKQPPWALNDP